MASAIAFFKEIMPSLKAVVFDTALGMGRSGPIKEQGWYSARADSASKKLKAREATFGRRMLRYESYE
jgi:hypothetical protein